jgi:hypothetical protein
MLSLPATVPIDDIIKTHSEYHPDKIRQYTAAYEGGSAFENIVDEMLVKREIEYTNSDLYKQRKERADYINRAGGLLDFLKAAVFKAEPYIQPAEDDEYWLGLNLNADGNWKSTPATMRDGLLSMTVNKRAYFFADFKDEIFDPKSPTTANARLRVLGAEIVDDWGRDDSGALSWVRLHTVEMVRENENNVTEQPNVERHRWTYIDSDSMQTYEAYSDPDQPIEGSQKPAALIASPNGGKHEFGCLPVFEIKAGTGQWVMDRIFPVVKSLFNRESALTYQLDKQAFSQLVLTLANSKRIGKIWSSISSAIILEAGENAGYITPPNTGFEEQFKDVDRLVKSLYEVVQALALNASATQTQNARQSAAAKEMDRDPLQTLLASFAWPIVSALQQWIEAVKKYRGDTFDVRVGGLDQFTAKMEDLEDGKGEEREGDRGEEEGRGAGGDDSAGGESGSSTAVSTGGNGGTGSDL